MEFYNELKKERIEREKRGGLIMQRSLGCEGGGI